MGRACSTHGEKMNEYRVLVGKPEGNRQLRRRRHTWEDNSKMDLGDVGLGAVDWIDLAKDTDQWRVLVNTRVNFRDP
jgi:hypothetical protein